jgi:beta-lactamase class A
VTTLCAHGDNLPEFHSDTLHDNQRVPHLMTFRITRRGALLATASTICASRVSARSSFSSSADTSAFAELEKRNHGRLGVAALDTGTGHLLQHRENERFALCSTFKFLAAAAILQRVDQGRERLDRRVTYGERDLLQHSPVSKEHVESGGMSLEEACAAAVQWSDNTAANELFELLEGPAGLTRFIRSLGDDVTRLDRIEPDLNVVAPGEVRDTTSPASMLKLLSTVLFGQVLAPTSRAQLQAWMLEAKVGEKRLAAGLPAGWRIAHKPGTWSAETNDVGVIWPPDRAPIVIAAFYNYSNGANDPDDAHEDVLRDVARIIVERLET